MAVLTVTPIKKAGIADLSASMVAAAAAGDSYPASSGLFIAMTNDDAGSHTLTVAAPSSTTNTASLGALDVDDVALVVAAGDTGFVSVPSGYSDADGNITWTYDDETSVSVGVFSIAP